MTMLKRRQPLVLLGTAYLVYIWAPSSLAQNKVVEGGSTWVVQKTTALKSLSVGKNAIVQAPEGKSLTLTVNGVETAIRPGNYKGDVVLTTTEDIPVKHMGGNEPYEFRTAVYIDNGRYAKDKSVVAAASGTATNSVAKDLKITSKGERFNGIVVSGESTYSIVNADIDLTGNGKDDFAGFGAAVASMGHAQVTLDHARIRTRGAVRTAVFVGGNSTMTVNDSDIEVFNGTLPPDYKFSIAPGTMMEVPYGLGISGNVRATNLIDTGTVYYNNSHVRAQGWGALSSDGDGPTHMFATNTLVETVESGYGAYSNGDAHDIFTKCTFNVADYGLVVGGNGSGTFTGGSIVNSRRFGVMMHQGTGGGTLLIEKGSVFNTKLATIEVKGRGTNIVIDGAQLHPANGVLIQTMNNDDPIMRNMMNGPPPPGGPNPAGGAAISTDFPGGGPSHPVFSGDVKADLKNVDLQGDIVHAMKGTGNMIVTLDHATLQGAISLGVASPASGAEPTRATFQTIGEVANVLGADTGTFGLSVALDGSSKWIVAKTSYMSELIVSEGTVISGPAGSSVKLMVDGVATSLRAGKYTGQVVLTPGA